MVHIITCGALVCETLGTHISSAVIWILNQMYWVSPFYELIQSCNWMPEPKLTVKLTICTLCLGPFTSWPTFLMGHRYYVRSNFSLIFLSFFVHVRLASVFLIISFCSYIVWFYWWVFSYKLQKKGLQKLVYLEGRCHSLSKEWRFCRMGWESLCVWLPSVSTTFCLQASRYHWNK